MTPTLSPAWMALGLLLLLLPMTGCSSIIARDEALFDADRAQYELVEAKARAEIAEAELAEAKARAELAEAELAEAKARAELRELIGASP